ncbi:manganese efflux pump [Paenibacillus andongensis]|uniref:manganese efflux pump n=1 Tax=Paenibacillus andongensis TaxID=2975482 RepID=UPI0021BB74EB|nr:hypothetical protein [Paenibacillus andongensis]
MPSRDGSKTVGTTESIILGITLSINNLAGGFDAGIIHLNIWAISSISGLFSYICIGLSAFIGAKFAAQRLGPSASFISGALLDSLTRVVNILKAGHPLM